MKTIFSLLTNSFKIKCKNVPVKYMKAYGGVEVLPQIIDLALDGGSCQIHAPAALSPKEKPPLPID